MPAADGTEHHVPDEIQIDRASAYLVKVTDHLRARVTPQDAPLIAVLEHISRYVDVTRRDIAELRSSDGSSASFATAADQLEEVVAEAARATNEILSAAETIQGLDPAAPDREAALTDAVTRIMVACAFQDITGQRIAKVIRTLKEIEMKVVSLATACGGAAESCGLDREPTGASDDDALLNGPQLSGSAQTQDDIDKLFDATG